MFSGLSNSLGRLTGGLLGKSVITERDVSEALETVRKSLIEADTSPETVSYLIDRIRDKILGSDYKSRSISGYVVVEILKEEICALLGQTDATVDLKSKPSFIMMVGLQGVGKTTSSAKFALYLKNKLKKNVLLVSLDVNRPGAQEQLRLLGERVGIDSFPVINKADPIAILKKAMLAADAYDAVILDTAGRLHIDTSLMDELCEIKSMTKPSEILLVSDAMIGQDAVRVASAFHGMLGLTGIVMTRTDGDSSGGSIMSMKFVTSCSVKFMGYGEKPEDFDSFHPDRIAGRIIGCGDLESIAEKAIDEFGEEDIKKLTARAEKGDFNFNDMLSQLKFLKKMGGIKSVMNFLPGMGGMQSQLGNIDDSLFAQYEALILSMTVRERKFPQLLIHNPSRKARISRGAGLGNHVISNFLKHFQQMSKMMKKMGKFKDSIPADFDLSKISDMLQRGGGGKLPF